MFVVRSFQGKAYTIQEVGDVRGEKAKATAKGGQELGLLFLDHIRDLKLWSVFPSSSGSFDLVIMLATFLQQPWSSHRLPVTK